MPHPLLPLLLSSGIQKENLAPLELIVGDKVMGTHPTKLYTIEDSLKREIKILIERSEHIRLVAQ